MVGHRGLGRVDHDGGRVGEWEGGKVGQRKLGRVDRNSGRVGEWEGGKVGQTGLGRVDRRAASSISPSSRDVEIGARDNSGTSALLSILELIPRRSLANDNFLRRPRPDEPLACEVGCG